ncbi:hypothetical protein PMG11_01275 [Penicillium brasilianum]|uniref:Uncharacterized protein n=1 Tax=Penicillium brasilianum TaxID=104259 RepID=A0A0F7THL1_PENBI|nr:hypothetical protein PMG11_01275 [Penicillium brasilianum]
MPTIKQEIVSAALCFTQTSLPYEEASFPASINTSEAKLVEQLFLDFSVQEVRQNEMNGFPIVEPWATEYLNSIRDGRYGDAVWARYHIAGEVHSGIIDGTNRTVLEMIEEDALGYKVGDPEVYHEALSFYANTNPADGHPGVIEIILRIGNQDVDTLRA